MLVRSSIVRFVRSETKKREGPASVSISKKCDFKFCTLLLGGMYLIPRLYSFRFTVYYYWVMNLAALISFSILPVIALSGAPPLIPADYGAWQQRTHAHAWTKDNLTRFWMHDNMVVQKYRHVHGYSDKNWMCAGFFATFVIASIFMGVSITVFLIGSPRYIKVPPEVVFIFVYHVAYILLQCNR